MNAITRPLLLRALSRMGELAVEAGLELELCIYGGALMMLAYDARAMTKDVDAVVRPSREGLALAKRVGRELGLPEEWLNDDVQMFVAPVEQIRSLPWEAPGIMLTAPTARYLLAMKALACRSPLPGYQGDVDDLRFLIHKLEIRSIDEIQNAIDKYYPDDVIAPEHVALLNNLIAEDV
ncbi:MAG: hypothetical protein HN341_01260 [Verrucomicrobia bacterium]|jgi:hypothetical protein|nr:hypothetical protein [Verrucomicrobiota bacterium]